MLDSAQIWLVSLVATCVLLTPEYRLIDNDKAFAVDEIRSTPTTEYGVSCKLDFSQTLESERPIAVSGCKNKVG